MTQQFKKTLTVTGMQQMCGTSDRAEATSYRQLNQTQEIAAPQVG